MGLSPASRGWTLVELMIVVALLGVLAAIALNQFSFLLKRAREATLKGHLGTLRGAVLLYFGDNNSRYPSSLDDLTAGQKYLDEIPREDIPSVEPAGNPGHAIARAAVQSYADVPATASDFQSEGIALWGYVDRPGTARAGHVFVNCSHRDSKMSPWTSW